MLYQPMSIQHLTYIKGTDYFWDTFDYYMGSAIDRLLGRVLAIDRVAAREQ